jgi:multidrug efflux pump subunit AcrA (membrane-fusion protein)
VRALVGKDCRVPRPVVAVRGAALGIALLLAAGCFGEDLPEVTTRRVTVGEVTETVTAPARIDAATRQDVAAAVSGVVVALAVEDGSEVEAGTVVIRLDSSQVELAQQQAAAAQAAAADVGGFAVQGGGAGTTAAVERSVAELDARMVPQIAEARARAEAVEDEGQRAAALAAVDAVEVAYLTSRAGILTTGQVLAGQQDAVARSFGDALNQAVRQATAAQRAQADAAAAAAAAQVDELTVQAPLTGTVQLGEAAASDGVALPGGIPPELAGLAGQFGGVSTAPGGGTLRVGAPVTAGQTLFTVFDLSTRYAVAEVDEVDAPRVAIGQRARVLVDAFPDAELEGIVEAVKVEAAPTEAGGVGYPVRVRVIPPAPDDASAAAAHEGLRIGMTASAEITTATVASDLVVPSRALLRRDGATIVFVLARDATVRMVPVTVEALGEDLAAVSGELDGNDQVLVTGYEDLADGDEVERIPGSGRGG